MPATQAQIKTIVLNRKNCMILFLSKTDNRRRNGTPTLEAFFAAGAVSPKTCSLRTSVIAYFEAFLFHREPVR